ncbi:MAG TPA: DUF4350 domain-containing protein [Steroidobacteraceae bacterium]|jgi:hypothetical protein
MKDRLLTLALALGAFAAFYILFGPKSSTPQQQVTRPVSTEAGPNGYLGMLRWLAAAKVPVVSFRERFGSLADATPGTPTGNLLITTAPHVYPLRDAETQPLQNWIVAGNTLLVVAGLSDTPEWSFGEGNDPLFLQHLRAMTGLNFVQIPDKEQDKEQDKEKDKDKPAPQKARSAVQAVTRMLEPQHVESAPNGNHPLLQGVQSIVAISEFPSSRWQATSDRSVVLELASDHQNEVPALWLMPYGDGQIIVSAYGSVFTNKVIGHNDNAQLLANIARWSLGKNGRVLIDDAHQGLVAFYDPAKFFGDSRLHRSLWWLFALWLVFVLGPRRLRGTTRTWSLLDVTSFVRATGGFMARVLQPAAAGQRLFANFFNEIRSRLGLALDGAPVWDWLGAQGAVPASDLDRLQQLHRRAAQRRRVDLRELHNLIARIRAQLN